MSRWRPALRIARRTVRRNLGRSLLIAVLVGLPVAGATYVDVMIRTFSNPERSATEAIGSADAELTVTPNRSLTDYHPSPYGGWYSGKGQRSETSTVNPLDVLPEGSRVVESPASYELKLQTGADTYVRPTLVVAKLGDPLTSHVARLEDGRWPSHANEAMVTRALADRIGLLDDGHLVPGSTITVADGPTVTVAGLAQAPFCLDCQQVMAAPHSTVTTSVEDQQNLNGNPPQTFLVDLPRGIDADTLWPGLAEQGIALSPRRAWLDPGAYGVHSGSGIPYVSAADARAAALALLVTGLGLLEVVLLAGTAFAVGARRQVHDIGVIAATGATARQIRRIVLAQGLVLGGLGSLIGTAIGAAVAVGGRHYWEHLVNGVVVGWQFGPWEIAVAALVGAVSGVLAAVVPAIGAARMTAVDALSGRFRVSAMSRRRTPVLGAALVLAGVAVGTVGNRMMAAEFDGYLRELRRVAVTNQYVTPPSPTVPIAVVLLGAVLAVVGVVVLAPAMVTALGRLARQLPLSGRLAFRDASRHRHRTGPATSAIAVAVAGSVVFAFVLAGRTRADELRYVASLPPHVMAIGGPGLGSVRDQGVVQAAHDAAAALPHGQVIAFSRVQSGPPDQPLMQSEVFAVSSRNACCGSVDVAVADSVLLEVALGRAPSQEELAAIAAGKALVTSQRYVRADGTVRLGSRSSRPLQAVTADVPHVYGGLPGVFVSKKTAAERGWNTVTVDSLVTFDGSATQDEIDAAKTAAENRGAYASLDTGPSDPSRVLVIIAGLAAAFVTLVGVAITVALSAAEGKADLATLAAVGASPRRRRSLAAAQAFLIGGLGCGVGLLLGVFVSYTLRATFGAPGFVVPWSSLLMVGVVVPAAAVLIAAVFTPSRLPLTVRRDW